MSGAERCDTVMRIIDEALAEYERFVEAGKRPTTSPARPEARRRGSGSTAGRMTLVRGASPA